MAEVEGVGGVGDEVVDSSSGDGDGGEGGWSRR